MILGRGVIVSNPFRSDEFKKLNAKWRDKLKRSGFKDIESESGALASHNRRTIAWENKDMILEFNSTLQTFMHFYSSMPAFERKIMEAYLAGQKITEIAKGSTYSRGHIHKVIKRYKGLTLAIISMKEEELK